MYIPPYYNEKDFSKVVDFVSRYPFGLMINKKNPEAVTHLPFIIEQKENTLKLVTHLAKANPHSDVLNNEDVMIVFQGPSAYISPSNYDHKTNVPTWNYIAVHMQGKAKIITEKEKLFQLMEQSINYFEPAYMSQWKALPEKYVNEMLNHITGLEIEISSWEGKFKLSQNKTETEKTRIIESLKNTNNKFTQTLAEEMQAFYSNL